MEFGKHLGKGIWGLAGRALPVIYGMSYVVLVVRVLPEVEFGNFVLVQETFLVLSNLAAAFALQPLLKFAAETPEHQRDTVGSVILMNTGFIILASLMIVLLRSPLSRLLNSPDLEFLLLYMPALLAANFIRNFTLVLLQTRLMTRELFWVDAAHFFGAPLLILWYSWMNWFNSATDLVVVNIISLSLSSLVGLWLARDLLSFNLHPPKAELIRMWDYGKYSFSSNVSYLFYSKADSFILAAFTGPALVGVYNSVKIFTRVFEMVAQVMQLFVFPASSRLAARGDYDSLKKLLEKAITFSTIALLPVFVGFLFFAPTIIGIIYAGKYTEAIPLLQVFSLLCLVVPAMSVASNALLGLGHARLSFVLGTKTLFASVVIYLALIPWLGPLGATLGFVISSCLQAWLFAREMTRVIPITPMSTLRRVRDIFLFFKSRLGP
ncbi:MAG: lipopolysaccharide biosynthesis protein [Bacteroidota bacterium]